MSTPITYNEAAEKLKVVPVRIRQAVSNDTLTQVPNRRHMPKAVYLEQVQLFEGKKELSKKLLSTEEREKWEAVNVEASGSSAPVATQPATAPVYISMTLNPPSKDTLEWMDASGKGYKVTHTAPGETLFRPALADETDIDGQEPPVIPMGTALAILILLGLLTLMLSRKPKEAQKAAIRQAENTMYRMGLEKEDLIMSQRKAVADLISHPKEALELKSLLEREKVLL